MAAAAQLVDPGKAPHNWGVNLFVPFQKVDEAQRMVYGWASTPCRDLQDEIVTIDAIKEALPEYLPWGNIREMHRPSAIGVCKHAEIMEGADGDAEKEGLYIAAKIVDSDAWEKIQEGVYKGWSIGGERLEKIGDEVTKLRLYEISAVDRPANPECRFDYFKAVGLGEQARGAAADAKFDRLDVHHLAATLAKATGDGLSAPATTGAGAPVGHPLSPALPAAGDTINQQTGYTWYDLGDGKKRQILNVGGQFHSFKADGTMLGSDESLEKARERVKGYIASLQADKSAALEQANAPLRKLIKDRRLIAKAEADADEFAFTNSMLLLLKIEERQDVSPESGKSKYGDVTFADEKNKKYPIDTEAHVRAAWNYINKPKNAGKYSGGDAATIKRKIVAAWKAKIDTAGPPSAQDGDADGKSALPSDLFKIAPELIASYETLAKEQGRDERGRFASGSGGGSKEAGDHLRAKGFTRIQGSKKETAGGKVTHTYGGRGHVMEVSHDKNTKQVVGWKHQQANPEAQPGRTGWSTRGSGNDGASLHGYLSSTSFAPAHLMRGATFDDSDWTSRQLATLTEDLAKKNGKKKKKISIDLHEGTVDVKTEHPDDDSKKLAAAIEGLAALAKKKRVASAEQDDDEEEEEREEELEEGEENDDAQKIARANALLKQKTKTKQQVAYLLSAGSPLTDEQKNKLKDELHEGTVTVKPKANKGAGMDAEKKAALEKGLEDLEKDINAELLEKAFGEAHKAAIMRGAYHVKKARNANKRGIMATKAAMKTHKDMLEGMGKMLKSLSALTGAYQALEKGARDGVAGDARRTEHLQVAEHLQSTNKAAADMQALHEKMAKAHRDLEEGQADIADHAKMARKYFGKVTSGWTGEREEAPFTGNKDYSAPSGQFDATAQGTMTEGEVKPYNPGEPYKSARGGNLNKDGNGAVTAGEAKAREEAAYYRGVAEARGEQPGDNKGVQLFPIGKYTGGEGGGATDDADVVSLLLKDSVTPIERARLAQGDPEVRERLSARAFGKQAASALLGDFRFARPLLELKTPHDLVDKRAGIAVGGRNGSEAAARTAAQINAVLSANR